jgi:hypothetical protein
MMKQQSNKLKMYDAPRIKVVSFTIEQGFAGTIQGRGSAVTPSGVTFGGPQDGLMNHSTGDRSGLGFYNNGGNIFGETAGN